MILVVGDYIVDEYIHGTVTRISPEAPVPILNYGKTERRPGGAGNVHNNLLTLGKKSLLVGVTGPGPVVKPGDAFLFVDPNRITTIKTRILAENGQQMMRIDHEHCNPIDENVAKILIEFVELNKRVIDLIIISDYNKGTITPMVARSLITFADTLGVPVIVDSKRKDWRMFSGAWLATPNSDEYEAASGLQELLLTGTNILVTLGAQGARLHKAPQGACQPLATSGNPSPKMPATEQPGAATMTLTAPLTMGLTPPLLIPAQAQEVSDVTGAGDTVVAAMASYIADHGLSDLEGAAHWAMRAAAIAVSKHGTATVSDREMFR